MKSLAMATAALAAALSCSTSWGAKYEIDWKLCKQPDVESKKFLDAVDTQYAILMKSAAKARPKAYIAVQGNRYYPTAVQLRRNLVASSYLPKAKRDPSGCAVTEPNYEKVLVLRDAVYRMLCRSEIGIGNGKVARAANEIRVRAFTEVYEALKRRDADVAASDDPATPPGGAASCYRGIQDGWADPEPTGNDGKTFESHMSTCDALARLTKALDANLRKTAAEHGVCVKEGG